MSKTEPLSHTEKVQRRKHAIHSYKVKADAKRSFAEKFADWLTNYFGTVTFLALNLIWFAIWIPLNMGMIPGIEPFDPFPFGLLTMIVSLEAIFLAIVVLISQNREARVAEVREEIDLQINMISEEEITKVIKLLSVLLEKQGVHASDDPELQQMVRPIRNEEIERRLEEQIHHNGK